MKKKVLEHPGPEKESSYVRKNTEIPVLENYRVAPDEKFWDTFPKLELPGKPSTRVNTKNLRRLIEENKSKMSEAEFNRASKVMEDLNMGADAYQKGSLPALCSINSESAYTHGALLTDKIVTWIKEGYVAGPFDSPPMAGFRANPLVAVARNNKIRPVINMSGPKGHSFNENLDKSKIEKVNMTTARQFSYTLKEAGRGAKFSKFDIVDAYK